MSARVGMAPRLRAILELLRFSLAPTVVADLCGGVALARGGPGGGEIVARLAGVSLLLFCGGMALNAWVDREEDRITRPRRPLPSGAIPPGAALAGGLVALAAAPALAFAIGGEHRGAVAAWAAGMAALIGLYHTPLKRHAAAGSLLLGAIRGGDLLLGAIGAAGTGPGLIAAWPAAAAYAAYVVGASLVAHEEDRPPSMTTVRAGVVVALAAVIVNGAVAAVGARDSSPDTTALVGTVAALVAVWHLAATLPVARLLRAGAPGSIPLSAFARLLLSRLPLVPAAAAFGAAAFDLGFVAVVAFWAVYALVRIVPPT